MAFGDPTHEARAAAEKDAASHLPAPQLEGVEFTEMDPESHLWYQEAKRGQFASATLHQIPLDALEFLAGHCGGVFQGSPVEREKLQANGIRAHLELKDRQQRDLFAQQKDAQERL